MAGGLHGNFDRFLFVNSVKKTGGTLDLVNHQFAIADYDMSKQTPRGKRVLSDTTLQTLFPDSKVEIRVGIPDTAQGRTTSNKTASTTAFKVSGVRNLSVTVPDSFEQTVDEVILGYSGEAETSFMLEKGHRYIINLKLSGGGIGWLGYEDSCVNIPVYIDVPQCSPESQTCDACDACEECDPCAKVDCTEYLIEAIEEFRNHTLRGMVPLTEFVEITPVRSCNTQEDLDKIPYTFYCLKVCDTGDATALAAVQEQYPNVEIKCVGRDGSISEYQFLQRKDATPPVDFVTTLPTIIKGCDDCPDGYDEIVGGFLVEVCIEDDGADETSTVEGLPGFVTDTSKKISQSKGTGTYTILTSAELTEAQIAAFITANPTATVRTLNEVKAQCGSDETVEVSWETCGECDAVEECYEIRLPDGECGETRLTEIQGNYPNLVIEEITDSASGCQRKYKTTKVSNLVCEECDPIFLDYYKTEAPRSFEGQKWTKVVEDVTPTTDCFCGIRFKGKVIENCPTDCLVDEQGIIRDSVKIQVSGGYVTEISENFDNNTAEGFNVQQISLASVDTQKGGSFLQVLRESAMYFNGDSISSNHQTRIFKGNTWAIDFCKPYITYMLEIEHTISSQGFGAKTTKCRNYHFVVEYGKHRELEQLLNALAAKAGISTVQATA